MTDILIVEDDTRYGTILEEEFNKLIKKGEFTRVGRCKNGYQTKLVSTIQQALQEIEKKPILVMLDIRLPPPRPEGCNVNEEGLFLLDIIKSQYPDEIGVIIMTYYPQDVAKILRGYKADLYFPKDGLITPDVLAAQADPILKLYCNNISNSEPPLVCLRQGSLTFYPNSGKYESEKGKGQLTLTDRQILECLMLKTMRSSENSLVTFAELNQFVDRWRKYDSDKKNHISERIRKIGQEIGKDYIVAEYSEGYSFMGKVESCGN